MDTAPLLRPDAFASDLHIGHENIIRYCNRPFADVPTMNEAIVERWNDTVSDDDEIVVPGDVALGRIEDSLSYVARLRGRLHLVLGNHDRPFFAGGAKRDRWMARYFEAGFATIQRTLEVDLGDGLIVPVNHFPYAGDSHGDTDRYEDLSPVDDGRWLIHGQVHDAFKVRGRQINVGIDVWDYRPVPVQTIRDIITGTPDP